MKKTGIFVVLLAVGCVVFPGRSPAPLIIHKDEGVTYAPPGSEEVPNQKDAQSQFDRALEKEKKGDIGAALAGYRKTVHRFPKASVAATAQYRIGEILEKQKNPDLDGAATAYERLIRNYPHSTDFNNALEGEFRIGTAYLEGARQKVFGVATLPSRDRAIAIYTIITRVAPFSRYAPLAQFNIGQAKERQGDFKAAVDAYQIVVDKYPTDPAAADALYQIGFCYMEISKTGSNDRTAAQRARENFEDFLAAYPNNEKAAQAKDNLATLATQQTGGSLQIADYYYGQKMFRAAVVYYNDVIRQQPNSPDSEKAKARLDSIRAKYGDKYFAGSPAAAAGTAGAKTVSPKLGDGRLQAQTDTARRPDYVGPPVSAPTPPPIAANANPLGANPPTNPPAQSAAPHGEPQPPPVPEGEQPTLPSQ